MDHTPEKIEKRDAPQGSKGQTHLARGERVAMRLWEETPADTADKTMHSRSYETVGFVIEGRAHLHFEEEEMTLETGDSYLVPADVPHRYEIVEPFMAVEATSPPAS